MGNLAKTSKRLVNANYLAKHGSYPNNGDLDILSESHAKNSWTMHNVYKSNMDNDVNINPKVSTLTKGYAAAAEHWAKGLLAKYIELLNRPFQHGMVGFAYLGYNNGNHDCTQQVHTIFFHVYITKWKNNRWYDKATFLHLW